MKRPSLAGFEAPIDSQVVGTQAVVFAKVRVADILFVADRNANIGHANRINQKHVDFLLCDATSLKPIGIVELDDASHARGDRAERDALLDRACQAAGLTLVHVKAQRSYHTGGIASLVAPILAGPKPRPVPADPAATVSDSAEPSCPRCGVTMVLRTAKQGDRLGQKFWGCPNYPKCREVVPVKT